MVGGAGLLADTVGAVRKSDGRDALARQSAGGKDSLAREQGAFCSKFSFWMMSVCFIAFSSFYPEQGKGPLSGAAGLCRWFSSGAAWRESSV